MLIAVGIMLMFNMLGEITMFFYQWVLPSVDDLAMNLKPLFLTFFVNQRSNLEDFYYVSN